MNDDKDYEEPPQIQNDCGGYYCSEEHGHIDCQSKPITRYFTFGQIHVHSVNGITFDKDCVVMITAANPRSVMVSHFGLKWSHEYESQPDMEWYPRGVIKL